VSVHVDLHGDQLIATRHIDAEPALVWEAFTTPEHLAAFWGGHHASVPPDSVVVDLRVGGGFELDTQGPDGRRRRLRFRYDVVEPPTLLVLTEPHTGITTEIRLQVGDGEGGRGNANGNEHGRATPGGTTVVVHQRRLPTELRTEQARSGLGGILDRLGAVVRELTPDPPTAIQPQRPLTPDPATSLPGDPPTQRPPRAIQSPGDPDPRRTDP
jgi:uncharacterized protein YndB with AHSA1/START domain